MMTNVEQEDDRSSILQSFAQPGQKIRAKLFLTIILFKGR